MKNYSFCIDQVIYAFQKSPSFYEMKFFLLDKLLSRATYKQVDSLLEVIEKHFEHKLDQQIIVNNLNPVSISVILVDYLSKIQEQYSVCQIRCEFLIEQIEKQVRSIFVHLYMPTEMRAMVK